MILLSRHRPVMVFACLGKMSLTPSTCGKKLAKPPSVVKLIVRGLVNLITPIMLSELTMGELTDHNPQNVPISISGLFGHVGSAEHPEDLTVQPEVTKLTPQQRTYVSLRVRGFSSAAACRQLNLNLMAAHRWSNSQWFEAACEEERTKWFIHSGR